MIIDYKTQGVGIAIVGEVGATWSDAVRYAAQMAGQNFPAGKTPGLVEVRIIAKEPDGLHHPQGN